MHSYRTFRRRNWLFEDIHSLTNAINIRPSQPDIKMPGTPLDRVIQSQAKNVILAFAGIITASAVFTIWGQDIFPQQADPTGNPEKWSLDELRRWLASRNLHPEDNATKEQLLERVKANLRIDRA
ncbi:hypothetical protein HYFRA_00000285 [Hymenoscyphus fraxineus]|uniref:STE24 endopeptidase n=1 Tax=Hymenoscyphus fraxineus TaxID=746836 RepID=A0A9N9L4F4_9HELO|nr:hypothetical protein HYFRA_00000285 [Hymenoscyphus fraxineus]